MLMLGVFQAQAQVISKILDDQDVKIVNDRSEILSYKLINKQSDDFREFFLRNQKMELLPKESLISITSSNYYTVSYNAGVVLSKKTGGSVDEKVEKTIGFYGKLGSGFYHLDIGDGAVSSIISIYDENLKYIKNFRPLPNIFSPFTVTDGLSLNLYLAGENDDKENEFVLAKLSQNGNEMEKVIFDHEGFDLVGLDYSDGFLVVNLRNSWRGLCKIYNEDLELIDSSIINHHVLMNWIKYNKWKNEFGFVHQGKIKLLDLNNRKISELIDDSITSELNGTWIKSFEYTKKGDLAVLTKEKSTGELKFVLVDRDTEKVLFKDDLKIRSQNGRILLFEDQILLETDHQLKSYSY